MKIPLVVPPLSSPFFSSVLVFPARCFVFCSSRSSLFFFFSQFIIRFPSLGLPLGSFSLPCLRPLIFLVSSRSLSLFSCSRSLCLLRSFFFFCVPFLCVFWLFSLGFFLLQSLHVSLGSALSFAPVFLARVRGFSSSPCFSAKSSPFKTKTMVVKARNLLVDGQKYSLVLSLSPQPLGSVPLRFSFGFSLSPCRAWLSFSPVRPFPFPPFPVLLLWFL